MIDAIEFLKDVKIDLGDVEEIEILTETLKRIATRAKQLNDTELNFLLSKLMLV
jgi:hypothetical protein